MSRAAPRMYFSEQLSKALAGQLRSCRSELCTAAAKGLRARRRVKKSQSDIKMKQKARAMIRPDWVREKKSSRQSAGCR